MQYSMTFLVLKVTLTQMDCKLFKELHQDFSDAPMGKNPSANAVHWFAPWSRKAPQDTGQLSPSTTTAEPNVLHGSPHPLEPVLGN